MKITLLISAIVIIFLTGLIYSKKQSEKSVPKIKKSIYNHSLTTIDGKEFPLENLKDKVVLIVNVASRCGFTNQYKGLESIYQKYKDKNFVVVGVPANNFGNQEPGTNSEIKDFCESTFNVNFLMMSKISVKGKDIHPLYSFLTSKSENIGHGGSIKWNFTKFLIDKNGFVVDRFESITKPDSKKVIKRIESLI